MNYSYGTDEYINDIVSRYSGSLFKAAFYILGNTADSEDAVQNAFLKLIRRAKPFSGQEHEKAWLMRVTINNAKDMLKSHHRRLSVPLEDRIPDPNLTCRDDGFLSELFSELSEGYREILYLYYYEGYRINEIAAILGIPAPTVGTRLRRGRNKLKEMLERGEEDV